jgi:hypothetical protein
VLIADIGIAAIECLDGHGQIFENLDIAADWQGVAFPYAPLSTYPPHRAFTLMGRCCFLR